MGARECAGKQLQSLISGKSADKFFWNNFEILTFLKYAVVFLLRSLQIPAQVK